jgi:murein DD-endopeptidase MepM/ murein hydrolase activator NlpD
MNNQNRSLLIISSVILILISLGCNIANRAINAAMATSTAEPLPTLAATPLPATEEIILPTPSLTQPSESPTEESPPTPAPTSAPPAIDPCPSELCIEPGTFILSRPIGPEGRNTIDHSRRYGDYRASTRNANRGVQFLNSLGTPVLAVADGTVVVAGDDRNKNYGYYANAFGNLIILKHDLPGIGAPIYTLYAHLSQINVDVDDMVSRGEEIGLVGNTGDVEGSTLYFEIRLGENNYQAPQNPELWLEPLEDDDGGTMGALAGRILDADGNYINVPNIVVEQLAGPGQPAQDTIYLKTYTSESMRGLPLHGESFALGDLPAGQYQISFMMEGLQQSVVEVEPGNLTFITFVIE